MAIIPPRICDLGASSAADYGAAASAAAALRFSHVLGDGGDTSDFIRTGRANRLGPIVDVDLFERDLAHPWVEARPELFAIRRDGASEVIDPRRNVPPEGRALARVYEDPDQFMTWWREEIRALLAAGATGLKLRHPDRLGPDGWRDLIATARSAAPDATVIADTTGLARSELARLARCGFDYCLSSLPWWDFRAPWLVEEYDALVRIAQPLAPVCGMQGLAPASNEARAARLALSAMTATGAITPIQYAHSESDSDRENGLEIEDVVRTVNGIIASNAIVRAKGSLRSITGPGAPLTMLARTATPDVQASPRALIAIINPDPGLAVAFADAREYAGEWDLAHGDLLIGGSSDQLRPHEARLFEVARKKAIRVAPRASARAAAAAAKEPRLIIANVSPAVDDGRFAAKAVAGDEIAVEADIFTDGHPLIAAELLFRAEDEKTWRRVPMRARENDRWTGAFRAERVGRYRFAIEAWIDKYGGFVRDLKKKVEAKKDIVLDLEEGRRAIDNAVARASDALKAPLHAISSGFAALTTEQKVAALTAPETMAALQRLDERAFLTQSTVIAIDADRLAARFASWYELFPRSQTDDRKRPGTLRDVIPRLPAIAAMGFDVLYMPPIHPVGTTHRKGRNNSPHAEAGDPGSVYAIGSKDGGHDAIAPELGTFDDFRALVAAARDNGLEIALDFAIQCSPDHPWIREHHGWFDWRPDGSIKHAENPPKVYEDIVNVDFYGPDAVPSLWLALRDIVLFWAKQGVRIFRVDNPHTKPFAFWRWLIADVRAANPDIIFLSEAFTRPKIMYHLAKLGFTQSYTYFTWRNTKDELTAYMRELTVPPVSDFFRPNFFVNTPDINPYFLQTSGRAGFLIRAALATTLSGSWGMYSGFELCEATPLPGREEYADSEKYEVKVRTWDAPGNIVGEIAQLNRIRRAEPALQTHMGLAFYNAFNPNILYYGKHAPGERTRILVAVSLDPHNAQGADFEIPLWEWGLGDDQSLAVEDLLSGARFVWRGKTQHMHLTPDAPYRIWRVAPAVEA